MIKCLRCGRCCHYLNKDGKIKPCRYLIFLKNSTTLCRVYKIRLYRIIAKTKIDGFDYNVICGRRGIDNTDLIKGCPYNELIINSNTENKPKETNLETKKDF
jgi:hypothetical protein